MLSRQQPTERTVLRRLKSLDGTPSAAVLPGESPSLAAVVKTKGELDSDCDSKSCSDGDRGPAWSPFVLFLVDGELSSRQADVVGDWLAALDSGLPRKRITAGPSSSLALDPKYIPQVKHRPPLRRAT